MLVRRSLPGVRIETAPSAPVETLPRMDVAVFVGFASRGPLHCPVAVESVAGYEAVFGPDALLAWDAAAGDRARAHLGPAVRAFFANGGRRCWVVRTAWTAGLETLAPGTAATLGLATANRFQVPGVLAVSPDGKVSIATAEARSAGSWSDGLRLATARGLTGVALDGIKADPDGKAFAFETTTRCATGDLLTFETETSAYFAVVEAISPLPQSKSKVRARLVACLERVSKATGPAKIGNSAVTTKATSDGGMELAGTLRMADIPAPGRWIEWRDGTNTRWLHAVRVTSDPVGPDESSFVAIGKCWAAAAALALPTPLPSHAGIATLDLRAANATGAVERLDRVGLTPQHARSWWRQVPDDLHYRAAGDPPPALPLPEAAGHDFPLAASSGELSAAKLPVAWLPVAVGAGFGHAVAPDGSALPPLHRDGLLAFDERLFLDPALAVTGTQTLQDEADRLRYLAEPTRRLYGLHAALSAAAAGGFPEATTIAVPDAVHAGWPDDTRPHWQAPDPPELAEQAACDCDFVACAAVPLVAPELAAPSSPQVGQMVVLGWHCDGPAEAFSLEEAATPDFAAAEEIYAGKALEHRFLARSPRVAWFRVAAVSAGLTGPWSAAVRVVIGAVGAASRPPELFGPEGADRLLAIHRNMVVMAAACGEFFAVLSLPRHYEADAAIDHADALRGAIGHTGADGPGALTASHAALYHPWIVSRAAAVGEARIAPRITPPDGFTLGVMAARATNRGAWVAPANEPLRDVVGLTPAIPASRWDDLQDAQVNLYRNEPRGILALGADTLARTVDRRPLNVRRLLILLRRVALRRGMAFVFEPNGAELRRSVSRSFTLLLTNLHRRGAFAGATTAESFKLVAGEAGGSTRDHDLGRFLVEMRVAPSLPLTFLTVRLAQSGERLAVVEEL